MRTITYDEAGVVTKFGVSPESIPDYLALVGDSSDGYPGLPGWGAKSAGAVLAKFGHIEAIPAIGARLAARSPQRVATRQPRSPSAMTRSMLYRRLATLNRDADLGATTRSLDDLEWHGVPRASFIGLCDELGLDTVRDRVHRWSD